MDPIITQWNSEWVTGPGGLVFLMQKQNEALCMVYAPCRKMLEWLLAQDSVWLEGSLGNRSRQEYFPAEHVGLSSGGDLHYSPFTLLCIDMKCQCECVLFFFFLFVHRAEEQMLPFCLTLPKPLWEVCSRFVCVLLSFFPSVFRCQIKLVKGWERGC